jgi:hypothetical protein
MLRLSHNQSHTRLFLFSKNWPFSWETEDTGRREEGRRRFGLGLNFSFQLQTTVSRTQVVLGSEGNRHVGPSSFFRGKGGEDPGLAQRMVQSLVVLAECAENVHHLRFFVCNLHGHRDRRTLVRSAGKRSPQYFGRKVIFTLLFHACVDPLVFAPHRHITRLFPCRTECCIILCSRTFPGIQGTTLKSTENHPNGACNTTMLRWVVSFLRGPKGWNNTARTQHVPDNKLITCGS